MSNDTQLPSHTQLPNYTQLLKTLVAIPSASATDPSLDQSNEGVINQLANWCESLGMRVQIMPVKPGKTNLIATLGEGSGGLVLSGHTDTVPVNELNWHTDPYQLTQQDNRVHGIGTTDMKGFFPAALKAIESVTSKRAKLTAPIMLLATADEESGMAGAQALVNAQQPKASFAIIGEPTNLKPVVSHKGILMERIYLKGMSGHSSDPSLGVSALEGMRWVLNELNVWQDTLKTAEQDSRFKVPYPTLNLGCIHGGDNPNKICETCELHIDLRFLPKMHLDDVRQALHQRLKPVSQAIPGLTLVIEPLFEGLPGFEQRDTDPSQDFVSFLEELTGHASEHVAFGTEAPFLQDLGMTPVIMGPGSINQAHQPNEYLDLNQIEPYTRMLTRLIHHYCL